MNCKVPFPPALQRSDPSKAYFITKQFHGGKVSTLYISVVADRYWICSRSDQYANLTNPHTHPALEPGGRRNNLPVICPLPDN